MNEWGAQGIPFLFVVDYKGEMPIVERLDRVDQSRLLYDFAGYSNAGASPGQGELRFAKYPEDLATYRTKFDRAMHHIQRGDTYLLNLTCATPIALGTDLRDLFGRASAKYKLLIEDRVLVFSPEPFVRIREGRIRSYPMKGTIDASIPRAEEQILRDPKETAEHYTIVDLIRNDLSQVARDVRVTSFRHLDHIKTNQKDLIQVSSTIEGVLPGGHFATLGTIFERLLPAGSVTGAPKLRTCQILDEIEGYERGYYTGVFGLFTGTEVTSAVMIRYIEQSNDGYIFKSGGGITMYSDLRSEYEEMIDKIYVPVI